MFLIINFIKRFNFYFLVSFQRFFHINYLLFILFFVVIKMFLNLKKLNRILFFWINFIIDLILNNVLYLNCLFFYKKIFLKLIVIILITCSLLLNIEETESFNIYRFDIGRIFLVTFFITVILTFLPYILSLNEKAKKKFDLFIINFINKKLKPFVDRVGYWYIENNKRHWNANAVLRKNFEDKFEKYAESQKEHWATFKRDPVMLNFIKLVEKLLDIKFVKKHRIKKRKKPRRQAWARSVQQKQLRRQKKRAKNWRYKRNKRNSKKNPTTKC